ncbi:MAG: hypothetical protein NPIRA02_28350 [Nitrospirales bacterium]|nr:MAG: hypothetical protein NPIRA02_28350 [Nitrospirales bacterium]
MSKHIVLFSDGTGNSSAKLFKTNVWRLYQALDLSGSDDSPSDPPTQITYYDDGVGTSAFKPLALLGGAFGWGLKRNVIDLYTFLSRNYNTGDQIYCFGFSRGAFTIRVLSELVRCQGLVTAQNTRELQKLATDTFNKHRRLCRRGHYKNKLKSLFRLIGLSTTADALGESYPTTDTVLGPQITFLGLWDRVSAYGLPIDELTRAWNAVFPIRPKHILDKNVHRACHALALDDERNSFHPQLLSEHEETDNGRIHTQHIEDERVTQVWFAGAHTNVGGGYPDDGLSYVSLAWMMREAERTNLRFKKHDYERILEKVNPLGKIYDARQGLGGAYRYLPRKMECLTHNDDDPNDPIRIARPKIHESVIQRIRAGVDGYAPIGLPAKYAIVQSDGRIIDQPVHDEPPSTLIEHASTAQSRTQQQEAVWNLVWWKRIAYFASVLVVGGLLAFPLYRPATEACTGALCAISPVISGIGIFLPDLLTPWLEAFKSHPGTFSALVLLLIGFISIGCHIQDSIKDHMRSLWKPFTHPTEPLTTTVPLPDGVVYRFRTHWIYQAFFKLMKQRVLPFAAGLASVILIFQGTSQIIFSMMNSGGLVCKETQESWMASEKINAEGFSTNSLCWGSGIQLKAGQRYRLTLSMNEQTPWNDNGIPTDLNGFMWEKMTRSMYAGLLLRRHLGEPWFKPIARIGSQGSDEYPLYPAAPSPKPSDGAAILTSTLTTELKARRDGELFLFINDAILPGPEPWQMFYKNNHGHARITIEPVDIPAPTGLARSTKGQAHNSG